MTVTEGAISNGPVERALVLAPGTTFPLRTVFRNRKTGELYSLAGCQFVIMTALPDFTPVSTLTSAEGGGITVDEVASAVSAAIPAGPLPFLGTWGFWVRFSDGNVRALIKGDFRVTEGINPSFPGG